MAQLQQAARAEHAATVKIVVIDAGNQTILDIALGKHDSIGDAITAAQAVIGRERTRAEKAQRTPRVPVTFDYTQFASSHGKMPRGEGSWGFIAHEHANRGDYLDFVFWSKGRFQDAKEAAREHFAGKTPRVVVCS